MTQEEIDQLYFLTSMLPGVRIPPHIRVSEKGMWTEQARSECLSHESNKLTRGNILHPTAGSLGNRSRGPYVWDDRARAYRSLHELSFDDAHKLVLVWYEYVQRELKW